MLFFAELSLSDALLLRYVGDFMKKSRVKWNFEMVFGLLIFLVLGLYYVVLFVLFVFIKYL